jgi:hypothetical protein
MGQLARVLIAANRAESLWTELRVYRGRNLPQPQNWVRDGVTVIRSELEKLGRLVQRIERPKVKSCNASGVDYASSSAILAVYAAVPRSRTSIWMAGQDF